MFFPLDRSSSIVVGISYLIAATLACGGNHQSSSPTTPSAASSSAPSPSAVLGATINGTVTTTASRTSAWAQSTANLSVSVSGTATSAAVDGSGHFLLQNVPSGRVDLHFTGIGVDAHLTLTDVAERSSITIVVLVNGTTAQLDNGNRQGPNNEIELEGPVTSKSASTITVNGVMVEVTLATKIERGETTITLAGINVGDRVEVKGTRSGTTATSIAATKIEVTAQAAGPANPPGPGNDNDDDDHDDNDNGTVPGARVEVDGAITGAIGGACPGLTFTVRGTTVATNGSTEVKDTTCAALRIGHNVEVKGTRQANLSVLATRVERQR